MLLLTFSPSHLLTLLTSYLPSFPWSSKTLVAKKIKFKYHIDQFKLKYKNGGTQ